MNAEINTPIKELLTTNIGRNVGPKILTWLLDKAVQSSGKNNDQIFPVTLQIKY
ncbi:MAG: hypothetical protein ABI372_09260 [Ginsengibacter sp.]